MAATLMRWDPWRQLQDDVQQLSSWFGNSLDRAGGGESFGWQPTADVFEDAEGVTFLFDVPGVEAKDINVHLENGVLTIKGERKQEREETRDGYHRMERKYGTFTRSFSLPASYDFEKVNAETKQGVLRVFVPKRAEAKPRSIAVKVSEG